VGDDSRLDGVADGKRFGVEGAGGVGADENDAAADGVGERAIEGGFAGERGGDLFGGEIGGLLDEARENRESAEQIRGGGEDGDAASSQLFQASGPAEKAAGRLGRFCAGGGGERAGDLVGAEYAGVFCVELGDAGAGCGEKGGVLLGECLVPEDGGLGGHACEDDGGAGGGGGREDHVLLGGLGVFQKREVNDDAGGAGLVECEEEGGEVGAGKWPAAGVGLAAERGHGGVVDEDEGGVGRDGCGAGGVARREVVEGPVEGGAGGGEVKKGEERGDRQEPAPAVQRGGARGGRHGRGSQTESVAAASGFFVRRAQAAGWASTRRMASERVEIS